MVQEISSSLLLSATALAQALDSQGTGSVPSPFFIRYIYILNKNDYILTKSFGDNFYLVSLCWPVLLWNSFMAIKSFVNVLQPFRMSLLRYILILPKKIKNGPNRWPLASLSRRGFDWCRNVLLNFYAPTLHTRPLSIALKHYNQQQVAPLKSRSASERKLCKKNIGKTWQRA